MGFKMEKAVYYQTSVKSLAEAWQFIMTFVDEFPSPSIEIKPYLARTVDEDDEFDDEDVDDDSTEWTRFFSVVVSGSIECETEPSQIKHESLKEKE